MHVKHDANEPGGSINAVLSVHMKQHCLQALWSLEYAMVHEHMRIRSGVATIGYPQRTTCIPHVMKVLRKIRACFPLLPVHMRLRWSIS